MDPFGKVKEEAILFMDDLYQIYLKHPTKG
jgi:hypothetical protein